MLRLAFVPFIAFVAACAPQPLANGFTGGDAGPDTDLGDDPSDPVFETETRVTTDTTDPTDGSTSDPGSTDPGTSDSGGCPPGVICVDAFPYSDDNTTTGATSTLDGYSCAPSTDEGGPEVVYQVTLSEAGYLATELWGLGAGVDVDVHVLEALDADDCIDRGHWAAGALLMPGTYYVVVDSWVDSAGVSQEGAYSLDLNVTTADAYEPWGLDRDVLERALFAFDEAWFAGETDLFTYGVIDFSMPSTERRFFIMDLARGEMIFDEYVTHGEGSGDPNDITMASAFSNIDGSHMSSLGMVRAAETYVGAHGYSLRLDGLDGTYNDAVRDRAIVIHPAEYATEDFVNTYGYLGRSWGCPAVDPDISADLIDTLAGGALVLKYAEVQGFLTDGRFMPGF